MIRSRKYWIIYLAVSIAVVLFFSVRTSPIWSFMIGDYGGNAAATGMLVGKYWLQGIVPYRDLFALGGPLYFLIQALGWAIAGRTGIFLLQIFNALLFMLLMRKAMLYICAEKAANILGAVWVAMCMAICCGGDSAAEWGFALTAGLLLLGLHEAESVKKNRIKYLAAGILCGGVFLLDPLCGGMAYGLALFLILDAFRRKKRRKYSGCVICFLLGAAVICIPVFLYFAVQGCLNDMFQAMLLYPFRRMVLESGLVVIIHKLAKCVLAVPLLAAGVFCLLEKRKRAGLLMIICSVFQILCLMLCTNDWYFYMTTIPGIIMALAVFASADRRKTKLCLMIGTIVAAAGICFFPWKNYCSYMTDGVPDVAKEFLADLKAFQSQDAECRILFLDTDCTWYLLADLQPEYRYFTDQTSLAAVDEKIARERETYLLNDNDVIISTEKGWTGQNFDTYALTQVYLKKRGNICIYVPMEE